MKPEQKISEVALKIFLKYGYHATTIQQIADEAGVSKSAIHYYFRNKNGIYKNVLSNLVPLPLSYHCVTIRVIPECVVQGNTFR